MYEFKRDTSLNVLNEQIAT